MMIKAKILGMVKRSCDRCDKNTKEVLQIQRRTGELILACKNCKGVYIKKRKK